MGLTVTLYRFQIELSDIPRAIYETLDFRVAQHPSESPYYLLTRVLAFVLNSSEELVFAPTGLHDPDAAAIQVPEANGGFKLLIEIGNPSTRKLHKATKVAREVKVYTYKNVQTLMEEIRTEKVHRAHEIEIFSLSTIFLDELALKLKRDNRWAVLLNESTLTIQIGDESLSTELLEHRV
jgi:uncharacterized protein YaeQ